jgi:hypothetical protein
VTLDQQIKTQLVSLAVISGRELSGPAVTAYYEALSDLPQFEVLNLLKNWLKTSRHFPHPADIREKLKPEITDDDDAQDVANSVIAAVSRCGYTNPDRAKEHVGTLGWEVITRMGGWKHICETMTQENEGFMRAQIRDYTTTISKRAKRGVLHEKPELPSSQSNEVQKLISTTFNKQGEAV